MNYFNVKYLPEDLHFIEAQETKARNKILYNVSLSSQVKDANLFKKLTDEIWEFRTLYSKSYYRLLAFWDKDQKAMVFCTHGFEKKKSKTPKNEIARAEHFRELYFENNRKEK